MSVNVHVFVSFPQTLYTHIVTDIKNINAKHKNNKVNIVSTLLFSMFAALYCSIVEKEMATHSSVLAWRIPWTEKPGRLQSMGSHRVGHD